MGMIFSKSTTELENKIISIKKEIAKLNAVDIFNQNTQQKLIHIAQSITNLIQFAIQKSLLKELIIDFDSDPKSWLLPINDPLTGKDTHLLPSLSECSCINSDNFDRFKNNRRESIEASILDFVKERFPEQQTTINYLSLGGGGLLQDFIIVIKLMLQGYQNINIALIDPDHTKYKIKDKNYGITRKGYLKIMNGAKDSHKIEDIIIEKNPALLQFEVLLIAAKQMNINMSIANYSSIDEYNTYGLSPDLITAIDFDDFNGKAFDDTIKTLKILHPDGRMFLSVGVNDYIFSSKQCISMESTIKIKSKNLILEKLPVKNARRLNIGILSQPENIIENIIVPYVKMSPKLEEVVLTIAEPQETNFFGYAKGPDHPNLNKSEEFFQYYLNLFIPNNVRLKLIYIKGFSDLNKLLTQIDKEQDIIFYLGEEAKDQITLVKEDIAALHEKFNKADLICGMHATSINKDKKKEILFACEWIWNNDKKLIEIIHKHDDYSSETLRQFYKELLATEQNKHTQPKSDTCKPSQGGFFSESNTNATRHSNESGFTNSGQSEMATL